MSWDLLARARPELAAGGFTRDDGTLEFYLRVQALLRPTDVVLDLGAGRGGAAEELSDDFRSAMLRIRGKVARFVGADVDPVVRENPLVDEAVVFDPAEPLPFEDASFDLIVSDWVLEHIPDGAAFAREVGRLLKPGGWFCARTPNKHSYFALAARLVPAALEGRALSAAQKGRGEADVFPKYYRLNTIGAIRAAFPPPGWNAYCYMSSPVPSYHGGRLWLLRALAYYQNVVPDSLKTVMLAFLRKAG